MKRFIKYILISISVTSLFIGNYLIFKCVLEDSFNNGMAFYFSAFFVLFGGLGGVMIGALQACHRELLQIRVYKEIELAKEIKKPSN